MFENFIKIQSYYIEIEQNEKKMSIIAHFLVISQRKSPSNDKELLKLTYLVRIRISFSESPFWYRVRLPQKPRVKWRVKNYSIDTIFKSEKR